MVQGMINDLTEALGDAEKHDNGNSAAGTRVRKVMQAAKGLAQDVRVRVQGDKNSR
ncbi:MAG: histone H1 [Candidatus Thermoplasmatota archaeon]|nr:histone H1 [Candidatus Thermoplasmatota archaeon]MEE2650802.1 histone H1 [Candidatus Thermoplasmatota archaeon]